MREKGRRLKPLTKGKEVHDEILRQGLLEHHILLGNAFVHMDAKCGALCKAQSVLEKLPSCDIVSWNALSAMLKMSKANRVDCFKQMQRKGMLPYYASVVGAIDRGKEVHEEISRQGCWGIILCWVILSCTCMPSVVLEPYCDVERHPNT